MKKHPLGFIAKRFETFETDLFSLKSFFQYINFIKESALVILYVYADETIWHVLSRILFPLTRNKVICSLYLQPDMNMFFQFGDAMIYYIGSQNFPARRPHQLLSSR